MVAEITFPCCKRGHPWTTKTSMISAGRRRCRICHNARTNAAITARYRADPIFRKKCIARSLARYHRNKDQQNVTTNLD